MNSLIKQMKNKKLLSYLPYALAAIALVLVLSGDVVASRNSTQSSVEIGLAEVSPRGAAGGYAVPASGDSYRPPVPGSITLIMSPSAIEPGGKVTISWKWSKATGQGLEHVTVERCKTPGSTVSNCKSWVNVVNLDGKKFGGGQRNFTCFIFLPCFDTIESGTSPKYDAEITSLTPGKYTYRAIGRFSTGNQTSTAILEVKGSIANLTSEGVGLSPESTLANKTAVFAALIKNNGTIPTTRSFKTKFEYRWGSSGDWTVLGTPASSALANGVATVVISDRLTLRKNGSLEVRACADSANVITESDESDNCGTTSVFNMSTLFPGLVPLQVDKTTGITGARVTFSGLILNAGNGASNPTSARFCIDNDNCATNAARSIGSPDIPKLPAGSVSKILTAKWTATKGEHTLYFCVVEGSCLSLPFKVSDIATPDDINDTGEGVGGISEANQMPISLTAAQKLVRKGEFTQLIWNAGNSTCSLKGTNGLSKQNLQGSGVVSSGTITQKSVFTLTCIRNGNTVTAPLVTINLVPEIKEI
jgi:hypothetical protein